jgi:hypothetical protein
MSKKFEFKPVAMPPRPAYWFWLIIGFLMLAYGMHEIREASSIAYASLIPGAILVVVMFVWLLAFLIRVLDYVGHRSAALRHNESMKQAQQDWQARDRQKAALVEAVLVDITYSMPDDRPELYGPERQPANPAEPREWIAIHYGAVSGVDTTERERQLARLLAMQWYVQQSRPVALQPVRCYWLGSQDSWEAYVEQMTTVCQDVLLPIHPEPWQGITSLYSIIDQLQDVPDNAYILCAGCRCSTFMPQGPQPGGNAGLLWLFGSEGRLLFSRGNWLDEKAKRIPPAVEPAQQLGMGKVPVQICVSFAKPDIRLFEPDWGNDWNTQDISFDVLDDLPDMVALTLLVRHVESKSHTSARGWRGTRRTSILGVIKPNNPTESAKPDFSVAP